ncbi:SDR family oxidoreductase [Aspergillus ibericus CBS 121593]|uniref:Short-chain dehydrogenase/reductase 3 n=1 Tax=Aspergillus ibericus CBS 121593 TaxID=1448316 RepID=A0A395H0U4_9EURO|nr:short-chain dehydrogenase/reductase 2 [Aspergillus ibericus CBS 121593]RAL01461.1 short-chain dehydrogenase/reductase 2 [Aspergillus ibericus CBS 121593]
MSLLSPAVVHEWAQTALANLPPPAQQALLHPLVPKAIGAVLALTALRQTNRVLNTLSLNNLSTRTWDNDRELVLVTGGCSGIGKQIMTELSSQGARVIILDIQEPSFTLPPNVTFYKADITSSTALHPVAEQIRSEHGHPTVLVNNAGVGHDKTILDEPEAKIRQTFEVNTISHFITVREFLPAMIERNHGHVVTVASMASFVALGEMIDYCCSKASALAFHEGLGQELKYWYKATGVKTSVVHPFWVRTPMIQQLTDAGNEFKQPVLTVERVGNAIAKQIVSGKSGQVILPEKYWVASLVRAFPTWLQERVRALASADLLHLREWQEKQEKK